MGDREQPGPTVAGPAAVGPVSAEARFRSLVAALSAVVWTTDAAGAIVEPQPVWAAYTGQPWPDHAGWGRLAMVHPDDREALKQRWRDAVAGRPIYQSTFRIWHAASGGYRHCVSRAAPVEDAAGAVRQWVGTTTDVHEQHRANEELRASEQRYRRLIEQASDAIFVADGAGRLVDANPSACAFLGYSRAELSGMRVSDLIVPEDLVDVPLRVDELRAGRTLLVERHVRRRDGEVLTVEATTTMLDDGQVQIIARDVTARKAAEAERQRLLERERAALRVRDEFLASVSHDLRTPLTTIKGMTQLVGRQLRRADPDLYRRVERALASVDSAAARMERLVGELLDVERLQSGRPLELNRGTVDLDALVRRAVEGCRAAAPRHAIRFEAAARGGLRGWYDEARLERVLDNLLSNAVKYSPEGGEITVQVARSDDGDPAVLITVADRGIGIPADDLPHIFERYRRGANVAGRIAGAGIGLFGSRRIAEQHGGSLAVESREGEGATFTLRLPLTPIPAAGVDAAGPAEADR